MRKAERAASAEGVVSADGANLLSRRYETVLQLGLWESAAMLLCAILFVVWFRRMHRLADETAYPPSATLGWATWSWFVPVAQLWSPFRITRALYEATREVDARPP